MPPMPPMIHADFEQQLTQARALFKAKKYAEVIELLDTPSILTAGQEDARLILARACLRSNHVIRAMEICRPLLLSPAHRKQALNIASRALSRQGHTSEGLRLHRQLLEIADYPAHLHSRMIAWAHYDDTLSGPDLLELSRAYERYQGPAIIPDVRTFPNPPNPERRLRVGFISMELCDHSKYFFTRSLFEAFDRQHVHLYVYSELEQPDAYTERVRRAVDHWRDICGVTDDEVRRQIRTDRIDILVDLMGHVGGTRLRCLLHKPAPILVEYGETPSGLSIFDYRLTDAIADPPELLSSETTTLIRLPYGFHVYEPPEDAPPIRPTPPTRGRHPVFCCFGDAMKFSPPLWQAWLSILRAVPDATLMLKNNTLHDPQYVTQLRRKLAKHGVNPDRLHCLLP